MVDVDGHPPPMINSTSYFIVCLHCIEVIYAYYIIDKRRLDDESYYHREIDYTSCLWGGHY